MTGLEQTIQRPYRPLWTRICLCLAIGTVLGCSDPQNQHPRAPVVLAYGEESIHLDAFEFYLTLNYPELVDRPDDFLYSYAFDKFRRDIRIAQISRDLGFRITTDQVDDFIKYNMTGANLHLRPEPEQRLWRAEIARRLAIRQFLEREILDDVSISEDAITAYFEANEGRFKQPNTYRIRFVQAKTEAEAQAFHDALRKSKRTFREVAADHFEDPSYLLAVPLTVEELPEPFAKRISRMRPGQYSRVIDIQHGEVTHYYVLYLEAELPERQVPFEEAHQYIRRHLEKDWCREQLQRQLERFSPRIEEKIYTENLPFVYLDATARKEV